eukprot:EC824840.1.p2 GENE.EC824840.1~~EC824840.1.p2  ORF type:complete len:51 (+),score=20.13 EC824840.1:532-684(+)
MPNATEEVKKNYFDVKLPMWLGRFDKFLEGKDFLLGKNCYFCDFTIICLY